MTFSTGDVTHSSFVCSAKHIYITIYGIISVLQWMLSASVFCLIRVNFLIWRYLYHRTRHNNLPFALFLSLSILLRFLSYLQHAYNLIMIIELIIHVKKVLIKEKWMRFLFRVMLTFPRTYMHCMCSCSMRLILDPFYWLWLIPEIFNYDEFIRPAASRLSTVVLSLSHEHETFAFNAIGALTLHFRYPRLSLLKSLPAKQPKKSFCI